MKQILIYHSQKRKKSKIKKNKKNFKKGQITDPAHDSGF